MIQGIGTDICDVRRIQAALGRHGERFARKVLGPTELQVFLRRRTRVEVRGLRYLATRFAAKEAFSKAIGLGLRSPMAWRLRNAECAQWPALHSTARWAGLLVRGARLACARDRHRRIRLRGGLRGR
jgi:holo-[acyl-carrier-protein] synthase